LRGKKQSKLFALNQRVRFKTLPDRILLSLRGTKQSKLVALEQRKMFTNT